MAKLIQGFLIKLYRSAFPHWLKNALALSFKDIERFQQISTIELPPGKRILVLAPHPDDEAIGCGGVIHKCVTARLDVRVIVLTDGRSGSPYIRQLADDDPEKLRLQNALIETRRSESSEAMKIIGVQQITFMDAVDIKLTSDVERIAHKLAHELDEWRPDTVLLPFVTDRHADHFATSRCLIEACSQLDTAYTCKLQCMGYETLSPVFANVLVDISSAMDTKLKAIRCYRSQLKDLDYAAAIEGLNRYRALTGMTGGTHAEAFYLCSLPEYERKYQQLLL